jgi:hypothetical protein
MQFCGLHGEGQRERARLSGEKMGREQPLAGQIILGLTIENRTGRMIWARARSDLREGLVLEIYEGSQRSAGGLVLAPDSSEVSHGVKG